MSKNLVISVEPNVVHIRHVTFKKVSFVNAPLHYVVSSTVVQKRPHIFIHYLVGGVSVLLHRLLVERSIAVSACLLDPHSRPMKVDL